MNYKIRHNIILLQKFFSHTIKTEYKLINNTYNNDIITLHHTIH